MLTESGVRIIWQGLYNNRYKQMLQQATMNSLKTNKKVEKLSQDTDFFLKSMEII
jgi:hypothetical protein